MKPSAAPEAPSLKRYAMASSMSRLASSRGMTGFNFNCGRQLLALCGPGCEASCSRLYRPVLSPARPLR